MQVFINEKSLHGQYTSHTIEAAIRTFIGAVQTINDYQKDKEVYATQYFFDISNAIAGTHLGAVLSSNTQIQQIFFNNIKNASKWENSRIHDGTSKYLFKKIDYVNSSVAEISERKLKNDTLKAFLLNFVESDFGLDLEFEIIKDDKEKVILNCTYDEDTVTDWLIKNGLINPHENYDITSRRTPKDYQTVLKDTEKFKAMHLKNQGRKVYERINFNQLWVVDNLHYGKFAHIEVFDESTGDHLGTSPYNEILLETKYKEPDRSIKVK